ncbi:toxin-activating lysine-acyltransferase [Epibacterium sp. DP7N7-1]|nr:toxin-activating lysine-acyltransferase [Epibacterium sp. DP7N7-1]
MNKKKTLDQRPLGVGGSKALKPDEFGVFLGLASWLMSMSEDHKEMPFSVLDDVVLPAILLKQFRLIRKNGTPIAFISWATVSDEIKSALDSGEKGKLAADEWRSGPNLVIVECVSPFAPTAIIKEHFLEKFVKSAM